MLTLANLFTLGAIKKALLFNSFKTWIGIGIMFI